MFETVGEPEENVGIDPWRRRRTSDGARPYLTVSVAVSTYHTRHQNGFQTFMNRLAREGFQGTSEHGPLE